MSAKIDHGSFVQPVDLDVPVWRYMDLSQLVSLLSDQSLYLSRVDKFDDPHEGCITKPMHTLCEQEEEHIKSLGQKVLGKYGLSTELAREGMYASCWCMQESETDALWRLYAHSHGGIAVRTTYRKLVDAFTPLDCIGVVKYIDYDSDSFDKGNVYSHVMHKRLAFEYEHEVRVVRWVVPLPADASDDLVDAFNAVSIVQSRLECIGLMIPINIEDVIEEIVVSPYGPKWFSKCVSEVVEAFGSRIIVRESSMTSEPLADYHVLTEEAQLQLEKIFKAGKPVDVYPIKNK